MRAQPSEVFFHHDIHTLLPFHEKSGNPGSSLPPTLGCSHPGRVDMSLSGACCLSHWRLPQASLFLLRNSYIPSYYLQFLVKFRASGNEGMAGVPSFLAYFAPGMDSSPLHILKALLTWTEHKQILLKTGDNRRRWKEEKKTFIPGTS